jgi:hypothetical protein
MRTAVCLAALLTFTLPSLKAQSCSSELYPRNYGTSLTFCAGNGVDGADLQAAIAMWSSVCGESGTGFPSLSTSSGGDYTFNIQLTPGRNPNVNASCGQLEGTFNSWGTLTGGTVVLYQFDWSGHDCGPMVVETIAHEIGHVLGLNDSTSPSCSNRIMAPNSGYPGDRHVQPDECTQADSEWTTPSELAPGPGPGPGPGPPEACDHCAYGTLEPLVLDLDGGGIRTTALERDPVLFDTDGMGRLRRTGWVAPSEEGFLYFDTNHDGRINGAQELFGDATILPNGRRASNGYEALAAYDSQRNGGNGDGVINPLDRAWFILRLWVDTNHDGVATRDEEFPLPSRGVLEISLRFETVGADRAWGLDDQGNYHELQGTYKQLTLRAGRLAIVTRAVHDVYFRTDP